MFITTAQFKNNFLILKWTDANLAMLLFLPALVHIFIQVLSTTISRHLIIQFGYLMYLSNTTGPDIAYVTNYLAWFLLKPLKHH